MSEALNIGCSFNTEKHIVTMKKNYFSKNYQINVANYAYPVNKKNITNDIKYCDEIIKDFVSSLKKTEYEIDITDKIDNIKSLLTE